MPKAAAAAAAAAAADPALAKENPQVSGSKGLACAVQKMLNKMMGDSRYPLF